jgi:hypothetical protein
VINLWRSNKTKKRKFGPPRWQIIGREINEGNKWKKRIILVRFVKL